MLSHLNCFEYIKILNCVFQTEFKEMGFPWITYEALYAVSLYEH